MKNRIWAKKKPLTFLCVHVKKYFFHCIPKLEKNTSKGGELFSQEFTVVLRLKATVNSLRELFGLKGEMRPLPFDRFFPCQGIIKIIFHVETPEKIL